MLLETLIAGGVLAAVVVVLPGKRWSQEQVAHELRVWFPDHPDPRLGPESIYRPAKRVGGGADDECRG